MGWTFSYNCIDKNQIIQEICKNGTSIRFLKKSLQGQELWTIWENLITRKKEIILFLLQKQDGIWGYKDITESQYPFYVKCPLQFLKQTEVQEPMWRQSVELYWQKQKENKELIKKLDIGKTVTLKKSTPNKFVITNLSPLSGVALSDGKTYKLIKSKIISITEGIVHGQH